MIAWRWTRNHAALPQYTSLRPHHSEKTPALELRLRFFTLTQKVAKDPERHFCEGRNPFFSDS
jgi:hypothetical protein